MEEREESSENSREYKFKLLGSNQVLRETTALSLAGKLLEVDPESEIVSLKYAPFVVWKTRSTRAQALCDQLQQEYATFLEYQGQTEQRAHQDPILRAAALASLLGGLLLSSCAIGSCRKENPRVSAPLYESRSAETPVRDRTLEKLAAHLLGENYHGYTR